MVLCPEKVVSLRNGFKSIAGLFKTFVGPGPLVHPFALPCRLGTLEPTNILNWGQRTYLNLTTSDSQSIHESSAAQNHNTKARCQDQAELALIFAFHAYITIIGYVVHEQCPYIRGPLIFPTTSCTVLKTTPISGKKKCMGDSVMREITPKRRGRKEKKGNPYAMQE